MPQRGARRGGGKRAFAPLQDLRGDGDGDRAGVLAPRQSRAHPHRAGDAIDRVRGQAARVEAPRELRALGARADHAEVTPVVRARERGRDELEVERVAVRGDDHRGAGRGGAQLGFRQVGGDDFDVAGRRLRKGVFAGVDPAHAHRQHAQHLRQRAPDVPVAEETDAKRRRTAGVDEQRAAGRLYDHRARRGAVGCGEVPSRKRDRRLARGRRAETALRVGCSDDHPARRAGVKRDDDREFAAGT